MTSPFKQSELDSIRFQFEHEARMRAFDPNGWMRGQRQAFSQFGGETRSYPKDSLLRALGFLIWACSLYEEKVSRAKFWLENYLKNDTVELPGQQSTLSSNLKELRALLRDSDIAKIIGPDGVRLLNDAFDLAAPSIEYRHDMVHGHHMGSWLEGDVFRARGKLFSSAQSYIVRPTSTELLRHRNNVLMAAAIVALVDDYFDSAYN